MRSPTHHQLPMHLFARGHPRAWLASPGPMPPSARGQPTVPYPTHQPVLVPLSTRWQLHCAFLHTIIITTNLPPPGVIQRNTIKAQAMWVTPDHSFVKLNVDASFCLSDGGTIGGLVKDGYGICLGAFA
ncbi:uncharacterized protein G2W53_022435 [Senna tora]|uniref:Uncharacterized protein n=1 Tax=Senna tora TaxID=362788 RepID=A0A834TNM7_9FABA|nr:uncharacterized protein G2W53_022435 [Senna tora]